MIKLYKTVNNETHYWESWADGNRKVIVHWGIVGQNGENKKLSVPRDESTDDFIRKQSESAQADGYARVEIDDLIQLVVQYKTNDESGRGEDLDKRYMVEDLLNECLGWTGNGHCDGGDIGSGTINVFSFVIDPGRACDVIVQTLRENEFLDGAVIAIVGNGEDEVIWPRDFKGEFSVL